MKSRIKIFAAFILLASATLFAADEIYQPASIVPPLPPREFRAAWLTEVAINPDWPSKPGLTTAQQKAELISLLDRAAQLHLNAIIFQVRPACDAVYASPIEPWSESLTGAQGKMPSPFYDPLAFAIEEAHKRGLELHAWFNPFRAQRAQAKSPPAFNHISRTHPELVRKYGDQRWLDPGEPAARDYVLRVVMDVVKRYDVDGVQFDDYFYPYPEKNYAGEPMDFPDAASWKKFGVQTGLTRDDWRRQNINQFIQSVYQNIKAAKPWVKFGVSPFGIWRPKNPPQIQGMDAYAQLYADSRLWLVDGWLDYFSPQLYWPVDQREQSFPVLLNWWSAQNIKHRNLWPGLNAAGVGGKFSANEIARQIQITRAQINSPGEIFFHLRSVTDNPALAEILRTQFNQPALVPPSPWLDSVPPNKPKLFAAIENSGVSVRWETSGELATRWVFQFRTNDSWTTELLPANRTDFFLPNPAPEAISIRAVDRVGNLSAPMVLSPQRFQNSQPVYNGKVRPDLEWPPKK
ncbi:MAG TPA: family 10 glycosylhydrolase [Verrucomicrobiae bacterium]|nr:family 10 glycosylhydrolase [Verrucomicrobiae bacterium]